MDISEISPAARNAYYNVWANLVFPFLTDENGEDLHHVYVWAVPGGTVLEARINPRTAGLTSLREFPASDEIAWMYQDKISREGRLIG